MKKHLTEIAYILSLTIIVSVTASCTRLPNTSAPATTYKDSAIASGTYPSTPEEAASLFSSLTNTSEYDKILSIGIPLYNISKQNGDTEMMVLAGTYVGQAFLMTSCPDSMYRYFDEISSPAKEMSMYFPQMVINNSIGMHNLMYAMNYLEAITYFQEALVTASRSGNIKNYYLIMSNIVNAYYLRNDPSGLEYAIEIYEYGRSHNDDFVTFRGAISCAYMYYIGKQYREALDYLDIASSLPAGQLDYFNADALRGSVLAALGRDAEAERYFISGIQRSLNGHSTLVESYLRYGEYLYDKGEYTSAIEQFEKGLAKAQAKGLYFYGHKLYIDLAKSFSAIGQDDKAMEYMMQYSDLTDSVFNIEKERAFNSLRTRYERKLQENEALQAQMKQRQKTIVTGSISAFIMLILIFVLYFYRRRLQTYGQQIKLYEAHLEREKMLEKKLQSGLYDKTPSATDRQATNEDAKLKEIFVKAESLMKDEELFRDKDISIDSLAAAIHTNRSYLSKSINFYTGSSFISYVNSFRIRRAIEILSDPENTTPIKALVDYLGYNNISTFYLNFQNETGVPPSRYRQEMKNRSIKAGSK